LGTLELTDPTIKIRSRDQTVAVLSELTVGIIGVEEHLTALMPRDLTPLISATHMDPMALMLCDLTVQISAAHTNPTAPVRFPMVLNYI